MKPIAIIGTVALSLLLGAASPAWAQGKGRGQAKAGKQENKEQEKKAAPQAKHEQQQERQADHQRQVGEKQQANQQRQAQHLQQVRLSQARQQQLIGEQRQRVIEYRQRLDQQQLLAQQYGARLQQQKRAANYRFQQDYLARIRQQQLALQRSYDYNNDPYFYTPSSYSYSRGGSSYETNEYGATMLRQAINNGYADGYRAGQADQQDRWTSDYKNSYAYQDANYGYNGYYVNQADYNYYFREGFNRGYQDGYNTRTQYGQYSNGSGSILGNILSQILNLQALR